MFKGSVHVIKTITTTAGKKLTLAVTKETETWRRPPESIDQNTLDKFTGWAERYKDKLRPGTVMVTLE